jgi:hypothetical protein
VRFNRHLQVVADGPAVAFGPEKKGGLTGFEHPDKLHLAGLLNVLDGVVCCPNRIVGARAVQVSRFRAAHTYRQSRQAAAAGLGHSPGARCVAAVGSRGHD